MATGRLLPQEEGVAPALRRSGSRTPRRSQSAASEARPLPGGKAGLSAELASPGVPLRVARGSGAAAASAGLAPSSCLRVGLPRLSLAAPSSAMSKPPPKPVKPGKSSARCGYGSPGCGTPCGSSRGAPSDSVCTARQDVLAVWWQHLGRGHFLIFRRVAVKLEFLTGRRTGSALRLGGVCTLQLRGSDWSGTGTRGFRRALESCTGTANRTAGLQPSRLPALGSIALSCMQVFCLG